MPRVKRQSVAEVTIDRATEEMQAMMSRLPARSPEQEAAVEKHAAKFMRRIEKAQRRWHAMSASEQREWTTAYVAERSRGGGVKAPKLADLPMLFAIVTVCGKDNEKDRREYAEHEAARRAEEEQRKAEIAARREAEPTKPTSSRATRPSPELDDPATSRKHRKRRIGPSFGVVAMQMPDGSLRAPIYDDDDL